MPLHLRKSITAGPFSFRPSSSRIGLCLRVRGLRLGLGPRGHYVQAGALGFDYLASIGRAGEWIPLTPQLRHPRQTPFERVEVVPIENGVLEMRDTQPEDVVAEIERKHGRMRVSTMLGWASACVAVAAGLEFSTLLLAAMVPPAYLLGRWLDTYRRTTVLYYELAPGVEAAYAAFVQAFEQMATVQKAWRITIAGRERVITMWERNALPRVVKSNLEPPHVRAGKQDLYFFPDFVLVIDGWKASAAAYSQTRIEVVPQQGAFVAKLGEQAGVHANSSVAMYQDVLVTRPEGFPPKTSRVAAALTRVAQAVAKTGRSSLQAVAALGRRLRLGSAASRVGQATAGAASSAVRTSLRMVGAAVQVILRALGNGGRRLLWAVAGVLLATLRAGANAFRRPMVAAAAAAALLISTLAGVAWLRFDDIKLAATAVVQSKALAKVLARDVAAEPKQEKVVRAAVPDTKQEKLVRALAAEQNIAADAAQKVTSLERHREREWRAERKSVCKQSCNRVRLMVDEGGGGEEFDWGQCYLDCVADQRD